MPPRPASRRAWLWLLLLSLAPTLQAAEELAFPRLSGRVVDAAEILSPATETALSRELAAFEQRTGGIQIVVATLPSLQGRAIETVGYQLGRYWGIGQQDEDTGALLVVAPEERQVRIEVGYGLEGQLTDAVSWDIIQGRMLPEFRAGDFDAGVVQGVQSMLAALAGDYQPTTPDRGGEQDRRRLPAVLFWIFVMFILASGFGRRRRGGLGRALLIGSVLGGGGRGGGGFGGGGFSGGGGSFGGGGASGGW